MPYGRKRSCDGVSGGTITWSHQSLLANDTTYAERVRAPSRRKRTLLTPEVLADARAIINTAPVLICGPQGEGLLVLDEAQGILLNGPAAAGESYETFSLPGAFGKNEPNARWFSTTANKPYDIVFTTILVATAPHCPGSLRTDGGLKN